MAARVARWFLITAPVVAGIAVLIFGTAGNISTTFGIVLIGIGPIVWMWNWFVRMSFDESNQQETREPQRPPREPSQREPRPPTHPHPARKLPRSRRRPP